MIEKGVCNKGFIWNPSNCECEWNKSWDVGEYLDYENFRCRKKLVDKSVEECNENVKEGNLAGLTSVELGSMELHKDVCICSCIIYVFLIAIIFTINIGVGIYFFTINTWIVLKKTFLYMVISIKQQIINTNGKCQRN